LNELREKIAEILSEYGATISAVRVPRDDPWIAFDLYLSLAIRNQSLEVIELP